MIRYRLCAALAVILAPGLCLAQSGSIVQDEHDARIKADAARNTAYHNNAADNPKVDTSGDAALAKKIADSFKTISATDRIRADERARDDAHRADYAAHEAIFNGWAARASTGDTGAMLIYASMLAKGDGTAPNPERAFEICNQIGAIQPDGFYQAAQMLLEGGSVATYVSLARNEPQAMVLMQKGADRGSPLAKKWMAEHSVASSAPALPGIDKLFEATIRAYGNSVPPTDARKNQKLLDEARNSEKMSVSFQKRGHIHATLLPQMTSAGIATLFGVGMPADPVAAEIMFVNTPAEWTETENRAFLAYIHWIAAPGTGATYALIDKSLSDQSVRNNEHPLMQYTRALVAAGTNNILNERKLLTAGSNLYSYAGIDMMVNLAVMQLEGRGGPKDEAAALEALNTAVANGHPNAQYILGLLYEKGLHGVKQDSARATQLYQAAAKAQPAALAHLPKNSTSVAQTAKP